jgi:hypothetical protein
MASKESRYARQHTSSDDLPREFDNSTKRPPKKVKKKRHRFWHKAEYYIIKSILLILTVLGGIAVVAFAIYHLVHFIKALGAA